MCRFKGIFVIYVSFVACLNLSKNTIEAKPLGLSLGLVDDYDDYEYYDDDDMVYMSVSFPNQNGTNNVGKQTSTTTQQTPTTSSQQTTVLSNQPILSSQIQPLVPINSLLGSAIPYQNIYPSNPVYIPVLNQQSPASGYFSTFPNIQQQPNFQNFGNIPQYPYNQPLNPDLANLKKDYSLNINIGNQPLCQSGRRCRKRPPFGYQLPIDPRNVLTTSSTPIVTSANQNETNNANNPTSGPGANDNQNLQNVVNSTTKINGLRKLKMSGYPFIARGRISIGNRYTSRILPNNQVAYPNNLNNYANYPSNGLNILNNPYLSNFPIITGILPQQNGLNFIPAPNIQQVLPNGLNNVNAVNNIPIINGVVGGNNAFAQNVQPINLNGLNNVVTPGTYILNNDPSSTVPAMNPGNLNVGNILPVTNGVPNLPTVNTQSVTNILPPLNGINTNNIVNSLTNQLNGVNNVNTQPILNVPSNVLNGLNNVNPVFVPNIPIGNTQQIVDNLSPVNGLNVNSIVDPLTNQLNNANLPSVANLPTNAVNGLSNTVPNLPTVNPQLVITNLPINTIPDALINQIGGMNPQQTLNSLPPQVTNVLQSILQNALNNNTNNLLQGVTGTNILGNVNQRLTNSANPILNSLTQNGQLGNILQNPQTGLNNNFLQSVLRNLGGNTNQNILGQLNNNQLPAGVLQQITQLTRTNNSPLPANLGNVGNGLTGPITQSQNGLTQGLANGVTGNNLGNLLQNFG